MKIPLIARNSAKWSFFATGLITIHLNHGRGSVFSHPCCNVLVPLVTTFVIEWQWRVLSSRKMKRCQDCTPQVVARGVDGCFGAPENLVKPSAMFSERDEACFKIISRGRGKSKNCIQGENPTKFWTFYIFGLQTKLIQTNYYVN